MEAKKSFLLYIDTYDAIKDLSVEEKAQLLDAIFQYNINPENPMGSLGSGAKIAFNFLVTQFKRDNEKYAIRVEANRRNGHKGGRPKTQWVNSKPKKPDSDSESVSEIDSPASTELSVNDSENLQRIDSLSSEDISSVAQLFSISEKDVQVVLEELRKKVTNGGFRGLINDARKTLELWVQKKIEWKKIHPEQTFEEIARDLTGDPNLKVY